MAAPDHDYLFKLLLIGDSGVGKSALLLRFCDKLFNSTYITTIGVDFKIRTVNVNGSLVKLQIWDTAGQEKFRTITSTYYRGAHGIMVVYDVTSKESFENVKMWVREIQNHAGANVVKCLVGTKLDLRTPELATAGTCVSTEEGQALATELQVPFIEASAKSGDNVDSAFMDLAAKIIATQGSAMQSNKPAQSHVVSVTETVGGDKKKKCC